jgi:hypothetical protein
MLLGPERYNREDYTPPRSTGDITHSFIMETHTQTHNQASNFASRITLVCLQVIKSQKSKGKVIHGPPTPGVGGGAEPLRAHPPPSLTQVAPDDIDDKKAGPRHCAMHKRAN